MKTLITTLLISWNAWSGVQAQNTTAVSDKATDEVTIRDMVDRENKGNTGAITLTKNAIFASGAMVKPIIGQDEDENSRKDREQMMAQRLNFTTTADIQRLTVAQAGDMAYEFSRGNLSWDDLGGRHISFEVSYLRVWLKTEGKWKVDAMFVRPDGR